MKSIAEIHALASAPSAADRSAEIANLIAVVMAIDDSPTETRTKADNRTTTLLKCTLRDGADAQNDSMVVTFWAESVIIALKNLDVGDIVMFSDLRCANPYRGRVSLSYGFKSRMCLIDRLGGGAVPADGYWLHRRIGVKDLLKMEGASQRLTQILRWSKEDKVLAAVKTNVSFELSRQLRSAAIAPDFTKPAAPPDNKESPSVVERATIDTMEFMNESQLMEGEPVAETKFDWRKDPLIGRLIFPEFIERDPTSMHAIRQIHRILQREEYLKKLQESGKETSNEHERR